MMLVAALLAVTLRVLIPAGFMIAPAQAGTGYIEITLCTGSGERQALLSPDGEIVDRKDLAAEHSDDGDSQTTDHDDCAFFGAATTLVVPGQALPASASALAPAPVQTIVVRDLVPGRGLAAPPPPATAPPHLI